MNNSGPIKRFIRNAFNRSSMTPGLREPIGQQPTPRSQWRTSRHKLLNFFVDGVLVYVRVHIPSSTILSLVIIASTHIIALYLIIRCKVSHHQMVIILITDWEWYYRYVEDIAKLLPTQTTKRSVKKRSILIYQGEIPRQAYIVLSGTLKAYRLGNFGEEQIVGFRTQGDMFPETWIFNKTSSALYYYEALDDVEVLTVEKPVLLDLIDSHADLKQHVFNYIISSYTGLLMQINALEQSRAAEKLALMMYYLMFRYGKERTPGAYHVELKLTHTTLGSLMGLTRETTTMELGKLKRKKVISYDSKSFIIYRHELERRLGDESFSEVNLHAN